ncbi:MAG: sugar-binding transcriptional regulator [Balneolaceae bacterium]|nr:sugar-binding transcriptional regulator [Balneolaceae bacterium]
MSRPSDEVDIRLVSKVSSMYYHQDFNQQEIADRLHLSRPKVSRLLKKARSQGIVQIKVVTPKQSFLEFETGLEEKFGLKEVVVIESNASERETGGSILKQQLGTAAADYLHRTVKEGDVLGVTWGTTLQAMVENMNPKPIKNLRIVQSLGGVGPPEAKAHAADISRRLSQLLNGRLTLLPAPGIVGSRDARKVLMADRQVQHAFELISNINTLFVGIGALSTNPVLSRERNEITDEMCRQISRSDAVGDIALRFFNAEGEPIATDLNELMIGISLEKLKEIDTVVGIAGGPRKTEAIRGALNGGYIDVLITDHLTADQLLKE